MTLSRVVHSYTSAKTRKAAAMSPRTHEPRPFAGSGASPSAQTAWRRALLVAVSAVSIPLAGGLPASAATAAVHATPVSWGAAALPAELTAVTGIGLASGLGHSLLLTADRTVTAWGNDSFGQSDVPAALVGRTLSQVAAGANHSVALDSTGTVTAWGRDADGQTEVPAGATGVLQIAAGGSNSAAIRQDGSLVIWGDNSFGQNAVPAALDGDAVTAVAVGSGFVLALSDGHVTAWGRSDVGQLEVPTALAAETVVQIAAGTDQALALTSDGDVVAWGGNDVGQATVPALSGTAARLVAGPYLSGVVAADGTLTVWGAPGARLTDVPANTSFATATATETSVVALRDATPFAGGTAGGPGNTVGDLTPVDPGNGGVTPGDGPGGTDGSGATPPGGGTAPGNGTAQPGRSAGNGALALTGFDLTAIAALLTLLLGVGVSAVVFSRRRVRAGDPRANGAEPASDAARRGAGSGVAGFIVVGLALTGSLVVADAPSAQAAAFPTPTLGQLVDNDFVLYFANAGTAEPTAVSGGDHIGLFQSGTDQAYGDDAATGAKWGFVDSGTSKTSKNSSTGTDKTASIRYDAPPTGSALATREVVYGFDLPAGAYDVTVGFALPSGWSARPVDIIAEGATLEQVTAPSGALLEKSYSAVQVSDGTLQLQVHSVAGRTNSYQDPAVSYIIVRAPKAYSAELLTERIRSVTLDEGQAAGYAAETVEALRVAISGAQAIADAGSTDVALIGGAYDALGTAYAALRPLISYDAFNPGQAWVDTDGNPIQAHGGQVVPSTAADGTPVYYWYGEDRWNGYASSRGVHVYSSTDLYNWTDRGLALQAMSSPEQFDTDDYFRDLYADYTAEQRAAVYRDLGTVPTDAAPVAAILERPKVIFNESTGQWVLWVHADGPSDSSAAQYAKANAGVAVSDSPTGPFRYVDSYRLNVAPAGEPNYQPNSPGMARDMNLFVDTDQTGYIIYASEENLTLFVSKLADNYMFLSAPTARAVKGEDFTRTYIGGQREAPAVFLYDGTYYLITSGATGWSPNPAKYATASSMLGEWTDHGNPATGSTASTTHGSQSTSVITIDAAAGKFIYMGDRWTPNDLRNAPAVWLPLEFGDDGSLALDWLPSWTLEDLEGKGKIAVDVDVPETVWLGEAAALPATATVTAAGVTTTKPITWNTDALAVPGPATLTGTIDGVARTITRTVTVVPRGLTYLVDAGGAASAGYDTIRAATEAAGGTLLNSVFDQTLATDAATGANWGVVGGETGTTDGAFSESLRYVNGNAVNKSLRYSFDSLAAGSYDVYVGLYDPWSQYANNRRAAISVNGTPVISSAPITGAPTVATLAAQTVGSDGMLTVALSPLGTGGGTDVQLSWVMVVKR